MELHRIFHGYALHTTTPKEGHAHGRGQQAASKDWGRGDLRPGVQ